MFPDAFAAWPRYGEAKSRARRSTLASCVGGVAAALNICCKECSRVLGGISYEALFNLNIIYPLCHVLSTEMSDALGLYYSAYGNFSIPRNLNSRAQEVGTS